MRARSTRRYARSRAPTFTGRIPTVRDGIKPALKRHVTSVKKEQFIYELSQLDENTGGTNEARMDIIAELPQLRAMLDIRIFLSTINARRWLEIYAST